MAEMIDNTQSVVGALYPMALPQTVVPVTKTQTSYSRTQYNPNKLKAVMDALRTPRNTQLVVDAMNKPRALKTRGEVIAEALSELPQTRSFTGGFGEEIINPWDMALTSFARAFGSTYKSKKSDEREKADAAREDAIKSAQLQMEAENAAREDAIKAAQLDLEANKAEITSQTADDFIKYNDPNAKAYGEIAEQKKNENVINMLENDLEDIGKRFDDDFVDIDDMQKNSTRLGRAALGGAYGAGVTKDEKLARDQFDAWKGSMKNVLVNANRQAGSGSMSDADAARYEQNIGQSKTPAEARVILRSFKNRMNAGQGKIQVPLSNDINAIWDMIQ